MNSTLYVLNIELVKLKTMISSRELESFTIECILASTPTKAAKGMKDHIAAKSLKYSSDSPIRAIIIFCISSDLIITMKICVI